MVAAFPGELDRYRASKGTLRFSLTEKVPVKLIERIAKFRADEVRARKPAKAAAKKKRKA
jgi:uncharacterized protein YdhG (YjbR/CyaY superfamily)